ncbi:restriction endonuclease subunit S [Candidatus Poribacteria bacterium]|nr:restriction endonuclease subunit S [Candidatus Poribacteria bacterium]
MARSEGINIKNIRKSELENFSVPIPPIHEQRRIVDILKRADGIRRLRKQAIQTARELIPALFVDMFGKQQHPILRLGDVADVVSGVTKGRRFNGQKTVVVPYLRVANVQAGHLDLSEIKTVEVLPTDVERLVLRKGDVLLTEGGDYDKLGRGALWDHEIENCIHQNHIFRVRADRSKLDPVYFANFLQTQSARLYFLKSAKRTTNLASINMTQLRNLPVPISPLSDQTKFVARANDVSSIERQYETAELRENQLFESMLHRAFHGEL